jgi:L-iditol 2-dehydrogenase
LGVALHALDVGRASTGMTAAVFGCGPIGLLIVQLLAMIGARTIIATDSLTHRVAAANAMGATEAMQVGSLVGPAIEELTLGRGVDVAFEAAGDDAAVTAAIDAVRPGGQVVLVGIPADDRTSFVASTARRKGLMISLSRRMRPTDLPRAIHLAASGRLQLDRLVTDRFDLGDGVEAFASLTERHGLKVLVEP